MKKYIAHILPKTAQIWTDEQTMVDFEDEIKWDTVANSLVTFTNQTQPNILVEHQVNGGSVGRVEEAWADDQGVWAKLAIDPELAPAGIRWVSPRIAWNHTDVAGTRWPAALLETSLVSVPRFLVGQADLQETEMSQKNFSVTTSTRVTEMSELVEASPNQTIEVDMFDPATLEAMKKLITEVVMEVTSAAPAPEAPAPAAPSEEMAEVEIEVADAEADAEEEAATPSLEAAMAAPETVEDPEALVAMVPEAELRQCMSAYLRQAGAAKREAVMSQVREDLKARGLDESLAGEYLNVRKVSEKAYTSMMSAVQPVKATSAVRAATKGAEPVRGKMDRISASSEALRISKATGESYATVFKRLTA